MLFSARGDQWCRSYRRLKLTGNHTALLVSRNLKFFLGSSQRQCTKNLRLLSGIFDVTYMYMWLKCATPAKSMEKSWTTCYIWSYHVHKETWEAATGKVIVGGGKREPQNADNCHKMHTNPLQAGLPSHHHIYISFIFTISPIPSENVALCWHQCYYSPH